ncbi:MAG: HPr(Ser) kinase/phosphatase [Treponemataceae bacterium]|nr:HPr(Ser) kinase/phosphatase [Spirochaetales bacterium]MDY6031123.1 HPr(Ser) kinase/phosphatase [Treponemataceae bacterium]
MVESNFTVLDLLDLHVQELDELELQCISGRKGLSRKITMPDLNRPGLALSGFFDSFAYERIQLFGRGEVAYIDMLMSDKNYTNIRQLFTYQIPCCIFSRNVIPSNEFIKMAEESNCPILITALESTEFSARIIRVLSNVFAPKKTVHGVFLEVFGLGILLLGASGIGKSETALELIERGHRLVADDIVELRCLNGSSLLGRGANAAVAHHMEVRGLGIINIVQLYGVGAVREQKEVQLVVRLEEWDDAKLYDRIGTDEQTMEFLGVKVPMVEIPVRTGRNIPIIVETAAMNERLKKMGYFSAKEFNQNILKWIESNDAQSYYAIDDSY